MALVEQVQDFGFSGLGRVLRRRLERAAPDAEPDADANRARRQFISERLWDNPQAFSSEFDVQSMLSHFPSHF